jgi:threonylcarbamoyladenosine tRNA methylthiotransferase MtaB
MKTRIVTLGCKVNQFESDVLRETLDRAGHLSATHNSSTHDSSTHDSATEGPYDLIVINACVVTLRAEREALRLLRKLREDNPLAKIVVAGCLAEAKGEELIGLGADLVLGNREKERLVSYLAEPSGSVFLGGGEKREREVLVLQPLSLRSPRTDRTRAFLKIQDGCDASCAYCIIPKVRGRSVSSPKELVLKALREYFEKGYKEVVLTGIHLGSWGRDLMPKDDLLSLLLSFEKELKPDPSLIRVRLSSLEPSEAKPLLSAFDDFPWLAPHLHIPLQAGCDKILSSMNRPYLSSFYMDLTEAFKARYPRMSLGSDVLTGFPGETEEDFKIGYDFIKRAPINHLHIFPFSVRPGSKAEKMPEKVRDSLIKERASLIKELDLIKRERFIKDNIGQKERAIVENSLDPKSGRHRVLTGNYLSALLPDSSPHLGGELVWVILDAPLCPGGKPEARVAEGG